MDQRSRRPPAFFGVQGSKPLIRSETMRAKSRQSDGLVKIPYFTCPME
jgi:hypothetical protein